MISTKSNDHPRRMSPRGFTLVELMVALVILVVVLGAFGSILLQCRRVVGAAEASSRAASRIQAIGQVLHFDMARLNKGAVLEISSDGDEMLLVTGDFVESRTEDIDGLGSAIIYTLISNASTEPGAGMILARAPYVLSETGSGDDVVNTSLAQIQSGSATSLRGTLRGRLPSDVIAPPRTLEQVQAWWLVLDFGITDLNIEWTDGDLDGDAIAWYGSMTKSRYVRINTGSGFRWTARDVGLWPKAIKVTFNMEIDDPQLPTERRQQVCQYICEIVH
jgi:prepilin-type N-terminal cleavage/methylation domain-containing protein